MVELHTREPIISVLGHVDSGKTTLLDHIRGSVVASREAGGITQHIGATDVPFEVIEKLCGKSMDSGKLTIKIRGLLFIDTPGHEAFVALRRRGGGISDISVLVVDIRDGLMPQTLESIQILKQYKTPFVVAVNKVDAIAGWVSGESPEKQPPSVRDIYYKRFYEIVGKLSELGYDSDMYSNITDFTKHVALVPVSAKTGEGIPNLLMMLVGLTQAYLKDRLSVEITSPGKGTILEVKEEKGLGTTIDVILYEGVIKRGDPIVVGAREPIVTKVKALLRPKSLDEMRDPRERFKNVGEVYAAYGVKISAPNLEGAMAGAPVYVGGREMVDAVRDDMGDVEFVKDALGLVVKADTLGSLEALVKMLADKEIPIRKGSIGKVGKQDVLEASSVASQNKFLGVVLSFNSEVLGDAKALAESNEVTVFTNNVIYKLLEDYDEYVAEVRDAEKRRKEAEITSPAKFRVLPECLFRQSKPAIVGVEVLAGKLTPKIRLLRSDGRVVGWVKGIQSEGESVESAEAGEKVAISVEDVTVGRQIEAGKTYYAAISPKEFDQLRKDELSEEDTHILLEIKEIHKKRRESGDV